MPARDDQDYERRRRRIMAGALDVFAKKGFEKATNKDIADAAGIRSPGLIYHYFKDKADLFREVIEHHAPTLQLLARGETMMDRPPREVLTTFGSAFLATAGDQTTMALARLMIGEALRRPHVAAMLNTIGPGRGFLFLTRYIQRQMDAGVLRPMDAGAAARCFVGSLLAFVLTREIFPQPDSAQLGNDGCHGRRDLSPRHAGRFQHRRCEAVILLISKLIGRSITETKDEAVQHTSTRRVRDLAGRRPRYDTLRRGWWRAGGNGSGATVGAQGRASSGVGGACRL